MAHSPLQQGEGQTCPTPGPPPIIVSGMSFAIGMFDKNGQDVILGVDQRWVDGEAGRFTLLKDAGLKSIDLNAGSALAFTGHAKLMAEIIGRLYDDDSLFSDAPHKYINVLEEVERREYPLKGTTSDFEQLINEIVPDVRREYDDRYRLSLILTGKINEELVIVWWAEESNWLGNRNTYDRDTPYIATLPPEAPCNSSQYNETHSILGGRESPEVRIKHAVGFLAGHATIQSVSNSCILRRFSKQFMKEKYGTIPPSNSPIQNPSTDAGRLSP